MYIYIYRRACNWFVETCATVLIIKSFSNIYVYIYVRIHMVVCTYTSMSYDIYMYINIYIYIYMNTGAPIMIFFESCARRRFRSEYSSQIYVYNILFDIYVVYIGAPTMDSSKVALEIVVLTYTCLYIYIYIYICIYIGAPTIDPLSKVMMEDDALSFRNYIRVEIVLHHNFRQWINCRRAYNLSKVSLHHNLSKVSYNRIEIGAPMYIYTSSITTSSKAVMKDDFDPNIVSQICIYFIHTQARLQLIRRKSCWKTISNLT